MKKLILSLIISFITFLSLSAFDCNSTNSPKDCACTEVFMSAGVFIRDKSNNPVDSLKVSLKRLLNNEIIKINQSYNPPFYRGYYTVLDDSYTKFLTTLPEKFIFTAENDKISVSSEYYFNTDECNCHINKVSGPDTLRVNLP